MLELSPNTEARLRRKAERAGQSLLDYLLAVANTEAGKEELDEIVVSEGEMGTSEGSAADLFTGRIGRFRSGGDGTWSRNTDRMFAEEGADQSKGAETYLLRQPSLAKDWLRPEEEEAWQDL